MIGHGHGWQKRAQCRAGYGDQAPPDGDERDPEDVLTQATIAKLDNMTAEDIADMLWEEVPDFAERFAKGGASWLEP